MGENDETQADLESPIGLGREGVEEIEREIRRLLTDVFALDMKTKNFHWHIG